MNLFTQSSAAFPPDDIPGVGTFYDFQDRLLQRASHPRTVERFSHWLRTQCDKADHHKDKNNLQPHRGIINRLADRILERPTQPAPLADALEGDADLSDLPTYQRALQSIFYACFVRRSVELDLIDLDRLYVAGDGTKLPTWANPHGKKLCDCDNRGKKLADRCTCHRAYRDPLALWGWDSYRECWVYGYSVYELTS
jgi:hypothetical protein